MSLTRKQFLSVSGSSILGFSLFNSLSGCGSTPGSSPKKGTGKMNIEIKTKKLELAHTWTISRNSSDFKNNVFIKIERDGITGYGEAAPNVRYGEDAELTTQKITDAKSIFIENELFHYTNIKDALDAKVLKQSCAKAAMDIALMDWVGKA